jgi:hypothetical protein
MPKVRQPVKELKEKTDVYFEVEKLLSKRVLKGNAEYLVKWKGYGD